MSEIPTADWTWINDAADRFEQEWNDGLSPRIEDYLAEADEKHRPALLEELLRVEIELRGEAGEEPTVGEYCSRFPDHARIVDLVFEASKPSVHADGLSAARSRNGASFESGELRNLLGAVGQTSGSAPRVLLRDTESLDGEPVTRPSSDEIPRDTGRYQILGEIGRGGMGAVLRGRDPELGRDLAIKILLQKHRDNPELHHRFVEEAQLGAQIQYPGTVPVYEVGSFDGRPFFAMKLVKGQTLAKLLADRDSPAHDLPRFLGIFAQVCQTMAYIHARGVIHRDLKPSNIMVGAFGEVQVMDLGLARVLPQGGIADEAPHDADRAVQSVISTVRTGSDANASRTGLALGTPSYMAPEQACGDRDLVDERADVFGLGSILCEILTGLPVYAGAFRQVARRATRGDTADALRRLDTCGADAELVSLARRCLAVERDERPRNSGEVVKLVAAYQAGVQERLKTAELARAAETARAEEAQATAQEAQRRARAERQARRTTVGLAASILIAAALGGAGWQRIERDRLARTAMALSRVNTAMREATEARGRAQTAAPGHLEGWVEALTAAEKARDLLEPGIDPGLKPQVEGLLADISAAKAAAETAAREAERDLILRERVTDIRSAWGTGEVEPASCDAEYLAAFEEVGIGPRRLSPAEAAAKIRARPPDVAIELAAAIDHWADLRRWILRDPSGADRLTYVASLADPDPWRNRLRETSKKPMSAERTRGLQQLARSASTLDLPAVSLTLLGLGLHWGRDQKAEESVLRLAQQRHPRDPWINLLLARSLDSAGRKEEAIGYFMALRALRPAAAHQLGHLLQRQGRPEEAIAVFEDLTHLRPRDYSHLDCLINVLVNQGRTHEAESLRSKLIPMHEEALVRTPRSAILHANLAAHLGNQGKRKEAMAHVEEALRLDKKLAKANETLGAFLAEEGKLEEGISRSTLATRLAPDDPSSHQRLAYVLRLSGKHVEAIEESKIALRLDPNDPYNHSGLAVDLIRLGKLPEALAEYRTAVQLAPRNARLRVDLGLTLVDLGHHDLAIKEFEEAIRVQPDFDDAHFALASSLWFGKHNAPRAIPILEGLIRRHPERAVFHNGLGAVLCNGKHAYGAAEACFRTAIKLEPKVAIYHHNLGNALSEQGRLDDAIDAYRRATELDPFSEWAHVNYAHLLADTGHVNEAVAHLVKAIDQVPRSSLLHYRLAGALEQQGKPQEAIAEFRTAIKLNPQYYEAHNNLGWALQRQNQLDQAIAEFQKAISLGPDVPIAHGNLASALKQQGKIDQSLAEYRTIITLTPDDPEGYYNLGLALHDSGKREEAMVEYRNALKRKPDHVWAQINLGNALQQLGRRDEAIGAFQKAVDMKPDLALAHRDLGYSLHVNGRLDEAIAEYHKAIKLDPAYAEAYYRLGNALYERKKLEEAIKAHRAAIELKPGFASAHNDLGVALQDQGKLDEAIAEYREAVRLQSENATNHSNLGNALVEQDKLDEALDELHNAIKIKPDYAAAHGNLARVFLRRGKLAEAEAECRTALRHEPALGFARLNLGVALGKQGKYEEAIAEFRRVIDGKDRISRGHSCMAWVLLIPEDPAQRKPAEALEHARKAAAEAPKDADVFNTVAFAEYRSGHWAEALAACEQAVKLHHIPEASDAFLMSLALSRKDEKEKAKNWFDKAVSQVKEKDRNDPAVKQLWKEAADLLGKPGPGTHAASSTTKPR
jgi:serine/threonine-protein kinase